MDTFEAIVLLPAAMLNPFKLCYPCKAAKL